MLLIFVIKKLNANFSKKEERKRKHIRIPWETMEPTYITNSISDAHYRDLNPTL